MGWIFILSFVGIVGVVFALCTWLDKKETEKIRAVANEMGLTVSPEHDTFLNLPAPPLKLFHLGRQRTDSNCASGTIEDIAFYLFNYSYTISAGKNSSTRTQTVAAFQVPGADVPAMNIEPENFLHRIGEFFKMQDIDFSQFPNFSDKFLVQGEDEPAIREFFTQDIVDFFVARPNTNVQAAGEWIIVFEASKKRKPDEWPTMLSESFEVCTAMANRSIEV